MLLNIFSTLNAQDTVVVKPANHYYSTNWKSYKGKGFHGEFGREDITFSKTHKRIEYIYYEDDKRIVGNYDNYWTLNDSTLFIGDSIKWRKDYIEKWTYKKRSNGKYYCYREFSDLYEFGEADSLIPFKYSGLFYTMNKFKTDTLWTTKDEDKLLCAQCWNEIKFYKSKIEDKIYEYYQIDTPPIFLNGDSINGFLQKETGSCINEPLVDFNNVMSFIITKEGKIKNIDNANGTYHCVNNDEIIVKEISNWGLVRPASRKGKNVNVRWFITVKREGSRYHPLFIDSKENRKRYLKRLKSKQ